MFYIRHMSNLIIFSIVILSSCSQITPKTSLPTQAAFSGNLENSGFYRQLSTLSPDGDKEDQGWEVDQTAVDRYNAFVEHYGASLEPPVRKNFGVSPMMGTDHFIMTDEALDKWEQMQIMRDRNRINHAGTIESKIGL